VRRGAAVQPVASTPSRITDKASRIVADLNALPTMTPRPNTGFTLVEILVVLGILAILALMFVPSYMDQIVKD